MMYIALMKEFYIFKWSESVFSLCSKYTKYATCLHLMSNWSRECEKFGLHFTAKSQESAALCSCTWVVGSKEDIKDTEGAWWGKKVEGPIFPHPLNKSNHTWWVSKWQKPRTYFLKRLSGPSRRICSRLGIHWGEWPFFSRSEPLH